MRSSFIKGDPGYPNRCLGVVTVCGMEVNHCHTADEELGLAWCYLKKLGSKYREGGRLADVCLRGKVVVIAKRFLDRSHPQFSEFEEAA